MMVILNSLNAHNFPIFQPNLMILLSKFMVSRALSDKTYLSLGLLSTLISNLDIDIVWAATLENLTMCGSKGEYHPRSMISVFASRSPESRIVKVATCPILIFYM